MSNKKQPREELEAEPDALEAWDKLPQGKPSKQAFSPATGGMRLGWWLLILGAVVIGFAVLINGGIP